MYSTQHHTNWKHFWHFLAFNILVSMAWISNKKDSCIAGNRQLVLHKLAECGSTCSIFLALINNYWVNLFQLDPSNFCGGVNLTIYASKSTKCFHNKIFGFIPLKTKEFCCLSGRLRVRNIHRKGSKSWPLVST